MRVKASGPPPLGALGSLPTGEFVQLSADGALFAQFPASDASATSISDSVSDSVSTPANSSESVAQTSTKAPTSPLPSVFRWLTNPPRAGQETGLGRTPIQDPGAITSQPDGTLVFAENGAGKVRRLRNGNLTVLAGSGRRAPAETRTDATTATFDRVAALASHLDGALEFSTADGLVGIDTVGLVRRSVEPALAGAALAVGSNDETVMVNNRTGLLQRATKSGSFEDLPGTRLVNASQLTAVGDRFYVLSGPKTARTVTIRRGTSEATVPLPSGTDPLAITADAKGTLYVLDTQHRLLRLDQQSDPNALAAPAKLDGWKVIDITKLLFGDERFVGTPDTSEPQAMTVAGPGAIAISDPGTDTIRVIRFPQ